MGQMLGTGEIPAWGGVTVGVKATPGGGTNASGAEDLWGENDLERYPNKNRRVLQEEDRIIGLTQKREGKKKRGNFGAQPGKRRSLVPTEPNPSNREEVGQDITNVG